MPVLSPNNRRLLSGGGTLNSESLIRPALWLSLLLTLSSCGLMDSQRDAKDQPTGKPRCGAITWESC